MSGPMRWVLWLVLLTIWTIGLLTTEPVRFNRKYVVPRTDLPVGKFVHVGAYAFLTATAAFLPLPGWRRWLLVLGLSLHGTLTEYLQTFIDLRSGQLLDVLLNHVGIVLGLVLACRWWFTIPVRQTPP